MFPFIRPDIHGVPSPRAGVSTRSVAAYPPAFSHSTVSAAVATTSIGQNPFTETIYFRKYSVLRGVFGRKYPFTSVAP